MKRLAEHVAESCRGNVEMITASELRAHVGECLTLASMGKSYCITRQGKVMAFLTLDADVIHEIKSDGSCETLDLEKPTEEEGDDA